MENVYMYGRPNGQPLTDTRPYAAHTRKGTRRARMARELLAAHQAGNVQVVIGRASDYFGPRGGAQSMRGDRVIPAALAGKTATVLGDPGQPHTYTYLPDIGEGLATLGEHPQAPGEVWHLPNDPHTRATRQLAEVIYRLAGQPKTKLRSTPALLLRALGVTNPTVRELLELQYEFQEPFIVDSTKIATKLEVHATPLDQALADTLATYRTNPASQARRTPEGAVEDQPARPSGGSTSRSRRALTWMHRMQRRPPRVTAVVAGHGHRPVTGQETTMQAIVQDRYGSADVLELADIDQPVPTGNEVLIQVQAAGLHRGDWHVMTGLPYLIRIVVPALGLRKPKTPVLGMDVAGRVEAVGSKVTRFQPGEEVFGWCDGSFAEYASAPQDQLAAKPANLSFEQAAAVPISGFAALQALRDVGQIQAGQKVLVIGAAGAVGSFGVQLAKAFGAQVTGVASTTQVDLVRSTGADEVIDYTRADVTDGSRHWDLIIDTAGRRTLSQLRRALTPKGTLVIVGGEGGGRWMGGFLRNLRAPVLSRFVGQRLRMLASKENQEDLQTLGKLLEVGELIPRIGRTYPLSEVPEAMRALEAGNTRGKIVITV
jgi:NADPH:quinone reductase-like Zn-dependent oxidoreductase